MSRSSRGFRFLERLYRGVVWRQRMGSGSWRRRKKEAACFDRLEPRVLLSGDGGFTSGLLGDFDNSGQVSQGDLDLVLQNWGLDTVAQGVPANWINDLPIGQIDQSELDRVLQNWGDTVPPNGLRGDYNNSGQVEQGDLDLLLQNWGIDFDAVGLIEGWINDLPTGLVDQAELDGVLQNWGKQLINEGTRLLPEGQVFVNAFTQRIDLTAVTEGTRTVTIDLKALLDTSDTTSLLEDTLQVYLVDAETQQPILDGGLEGTPLFSWDGGVAEFPAGRVTFNGTTLTIDLTDVTPASGQGDLVFQSLNQDLDNGSVFEVSSITNTTDAEGVVGPVFPANDTPAPAPGIGLDVNGLTATTDLAVLVERLRYDRNTGDYVADVRVRNDGPATDRNVTVLLPGLPPEVSVNNASAVATGGTPYLSLRDAIAGGGLPEGATSGALELRISNPGNVRFQLTPEVRVGGPNAAPVLTLPASISVMPGQTRVIDLNGSDADGDRVTYRLRPPEDGQLPTTKLANGELTFSPSPTQLGSYALTVIATDGVLTTEQALTVNVVADPVTTTRLSGLVLDSDGVTPLPGVPVELNGVTTTTNASGAFTLTVASLDGEDAVKVRANEAVGLPGVYPFVAEKIKLVLENGPFANVNNVIARPIYLPALDVANGTTITPGSNTTVTQEIAPGETAEVFVAADTLMMDDGNGGMVPFTGTLSITEVPADLTPAALPDNLLPDVVVTIQPGEMVFTTPAPLTLPNRAGYAPGTLMDLWSINPNTGLFDNVGTAQVSPDGSVIETISGGVNNSSWHFVAPRLEEFPEPGGESENQDQTCGICEARVTATSEVELHSGAVLETHGLAAYRSLGQTRQLTLHYNSQRADARPIINFTADNIVGDVNRRLVARLSFSRGDFAHVVAGAPSSGNLSGGEHFWSLPSGSNNLKAAIQSDLTDQTSGVYDYQLTRGILRLNGGEFAGSLAESTGRVVHVNAIGSSLGAGWELGGVQRIVENPDGSLLLIDGNGGNLIFDPPPSGLPGDSYSTPPGDFTNVVKNAGGTFTRTATDQTVSQFDDQGRLVSVTDRNGNRTTHNYDAVSGRLTSIVDPVGLTTIFRYNAAGKVREIEDPAGRLTTLAYDPAGNLASITDPDATTRSFEYDVGHHLVAETDQNGNREQTIYGLHGRATGSVRKDGTMLTFDPLQTRSLMPVAMTTDAAAAPRAAVAEDTVVARTADANGNLTTTVLDQQGQAVRAFDTVGGLFALQRDADNLVTRRTDGRGFETELAYDERGNVTSLTDEVIRGGGAGGALFLGVKPAVGDGPRSLVAADFNGDGITDLATANYTSGDVSVLLGSGGGGFAQAQTFAVGDFPQSLTTGDFNGDGVTDLATLATASTGSYEVSVLLGSGDGTFGPAQSFAAGDSPRSLATGDFNGDGVTDLATASYVFDEVSVLLGSGDGAFGPAQSFAAGDGPDSVTTGDFNGDGVTDLATANSRSDDVSVLLGSGDGTFGPAQSSEAGDDPRSVTTGDFNGDGVADLATANLFSNDVSVLLGSGDGAFGPALSVSAGGGPGSVTTGDFNGDGVTDLAAADSGSDDVFVLLGSGDGTFGPAQSFAVGDGPVAMTTGDFNGDGVTDLGTANFRSDDVSVLLGSGGGGFASSEVVAVGNRPESVTSGDFNGDGVADLATANLVSDDVSVLLGSRDGTFGPAQSFAAGDGPRFLVTDDLNGDGITDLATANFSSDDVSVLLGSGDGMFGPAQSFAVGGGLRALATGDFNGDGVADLATANLLSDDVSVLLGSGDGTFGPAQSFAAGDGPTWVITGDFNSDGVADLATANLFSNDVSVLLGSGDGTFGFAQSVAAGDGADSMTTGDFNDDGVADLAIASRGFDNVSVLLGSGDGTFGPAQPFSAGDRPQSVTTGDFNGDGVTDLATANYLSDDVSVLLGSGDGTFGPAQAFAAGDGTKSVTSGDFNGDGFTDLATANFDDVSVLLNQSNGSSGGIARPRTFTYESVFSQLTSTTDELGRMTLYDVDPLNGNRLSERRVVGELDSVANGGTDDLVTSFTYLGNGLVDLVTDPLGRVTDFDYNARGLVERVTLAVGTSDEAFQLFEYDLAGNQIAVIDENGNRTEFVFDAMNRLTQITEADPDGPGSGGPLTSPITTFDYDDRGNLTETVDAANSDTTNVYDALDRLVLSRDADGNETTFAYDADGNLLSTTDPNGNTTSFSYDARDRRVTSTDADSGVTRFRYDRDGNLTSLVDPSGNATTFAYDSRDRLVREVDPRGEETLYRYDAADNLIETTDRNGRITEFVYDDLDRLLTETWLTPAPGSAGTVVNTVDYVYDAAGNLLSVTDDFSALAFTYDARNRVDTVDNAAPGSPTGTPQVVLDYSYDGVGNVLSVTDAITGLPSGGGANIYGYDALNRLTTLQQAGTTTSQKRVDFTYNQLGQFTDIDRYGDLSGTQLAVGTTYTYDDLNRLTDLDHTRAGGPSGGVAFYDFGYDAASRITALTDVDGRTDYTYDDTDQLTGADRAAADFRGDEDYAYDANGNRTDSHRHGPGYVTGPGNQLLSDGTYDYTYDAAGNMVSRTEIATGLFRGFAYDHRNRLVRVTDAASESGTVTQAVEYVYDALGRRIARTVDSNGDAAGGERTEHYVYDRDDVLLDFVDADGSGTAEQAELATRYLFGPGVDQVLAQEHFVNGTSGGTTWLLTDHLGTVRDLVDDSGTVLNHLTYDSFGNVLGETDPAVDTRYLYTGRELDDATGLYYYRARFYDSNVGRFISEDPIGFGGGDANLSRYVFSQPIALVDPSGQIVPILVGGGVVVVGGLVGGLANAISGESFFSGFGKGAATTLVGIGVSAAAPALGASTAVAAGLGTAASALSGAGLNQFERVIDSDPCNNEFDAQQFGTDALIGVLSSGAARGLLPSRGIFPQVGRKVTNSSPIFRTGLQINAARRLGSVFIENAAGKSVSAIIKPGVNFAAD